MFSCLLLILIYITNVLSFDLQNFLPYVHNESLYITNNNNYNNKYYKEGSYLYEIINKYDDNCLNSCYNKFENIRSEYTIAIIGIMRKNFIEWRIYL